MSTHRSTWKRRERDAARLFGAERQVCSGSAGRADRSCSDSTHDRLFIEAKLRATSAVRNLWEATRDRARRERKAPVLMLFAKGKPGGLIVIHQDDLPAIAAELSDLMAGNQGPRKARERSEKGPPEDADEFAALMAGRDEERPEFESDAIEGESS